MIEITAERSEHQMTVVFSGHAGYAAPGQDIVCAGVSALFYALIAGVKEIDACAIAVDGKTVTVTNITSRISGAITTILAGLNAIERAYPEHIKIHCPSGT